MRYLLLALSTLALLTSPVRQALAISAVEHESFIAPSTGEKTEFFWMKPEGTGPFPLILMIHPDQDSPKIGGEMFVKSGQLEHWAQRGLIAAAISQPGFGQSEGRADFCGPRTQNATLDLIRLLAARKLVAPNKIFVYGGSRGAVVASRVATLQPLELAGMLLKSGVYDFITWSESRPWFDSIKLILFWEIGWPTETKLKERSALFAADKIRAPLLVIHGTHDESAPLSIASQFVNRVNATGGQAELVTLDSGHVIPMPKINDRMETFIRARLNALAQSAKAP